MQVIGLHIGGSFAEVSVWASQEHEARARSVFYLPRHNLKTALPKFLKTLPEASFDGAFVTSRYLERLFDFRLGGSTAQLVTSGIEKWPFLSAAPARAGRVQPVRSHPISSLELTFAVDERIEHDGRVRQSLKIEDLAPIAEKLKLMQVKRVCVHFLHAGLNPAHEDTAAAWLRQQGFEVSVPPRMPHLSESSRWRASTLEASFSGTFEELRQEVTTALAEFVPEAAVRIHDGEGFRSFADAKKLGTLFADDLLLHRRHPGRPVLRLDLESWSLLDPAAQDEWQSPWGAVACPGPKRRPLTVQPTCALESRGREHVGFSEKAEGFEPGPLSLGRGQKLLAFDLWSDHPELRGFLGEHIPDAALTRRDSALLVLSRAFKSGGAESLRRSLRRDIEDWILTDASLRTAEPEALLRTGRMAAVLDGLSDVELDDSGENAADRAARAGLESAG